MNRAMNLTSLFFAFILAAMFLFAGCNHQKDPTAQTDETPGTQSNEGPSTQIPNTENEIGNSIIYVYRSFFNEQPAETVSKWAQSRVVNADDSFVIYFHDPDDLANTTSSNLYTKDGVPLRFESVFNNKESYVQFDDKKVTIMWNEQTSIVDVDRTELSQPHLTWFWREHPIIGAKVHEQTISQNTGQLNSVREYLYVRDETLKLDDDEIHCHLVEESREDSPDVLDTYWFDECGIMVQQVHEVAGEKRTTVLMKKVNL